MFQSENMAVSTIHLFIKGTNATWGVVYQRLKASDTKAWRFDLRDLWTWESLRELLCL